MLAAAVEMPRAAVSAALKFCVGRLIYEENGRLFQKRVLRDVRKELRFRREQSEYGKLGGRPRVSKGEPSATYTPPAPSPSPAPTPAPQPNGPPLPPPERRGGTGEFDLPPGMADNGPPGRSRHDRKAQDERLEAARLYAIDIGFHPRRHDLREMKRWVKAGRTLGEIQAELDSRRAEGATIMQYRSPL